MHKKNKNMILFARLFVQNLDCGSGSYEYPLCMFWNNDKKKKGLGVADIF